MFETEDLSHAINQCKRRKNIFAITLSENGSIITEASTVYNIKAKKVENPIDSTGAGDMYAAGFLHGYAKGMSLDKCGNIGSAISSEIIKHFGARPKDDIVKKILSDIDLELI